MNERDSRRQNNLNPTIREFSTELFGAKGEEGFSLGGPLRQVFETYMARKKHDEFYFDQCRDFVFDKILYEASKILIVPTILYDSFPDHGERILSYIREGAGRPLKRPGLVFEPERDEKGRYRLAPLHEIEILKSQCMRFEEPVILHCSAWYENGEIFRYRKYDHIDQAPEGYAQFNEDKAAFRECTIGEGAVYWRDIASVERFLRHVSIFEITLGYGSVLLGKRVQNDVIEFENEIIHSALLDQDCFRIDFGTGTFFQRKLDTRVGEPVAWIPLFTQINLLNRWEGEETGPKLEGLGGSDVPSADVEREDLIKRLNALEERQRPFIAKKDNPPVKTIIADYLAEKKIDISSITNVSELSRTLADLHGEKFNTVRRTLTEMRRMG